MHKTTIKYNAVKILAFTLIFFLNQTFANKIEILNVAPNLVFAMILCASLTENDPANIYYALAYGLLFDFFNSKILFIHGILFLLISFVLSEIYHKFFENMVTVKMILELETGILFFLWNRSGISVIVFLCGNFAYCFKN